jgi:hypothetical protein
MEHHRFAVEEAANDVEKASTQKGASLKTFCGCPILNRQNPLC